MDSIISFGKPAPQFQLVDLKGNLYSLKDTLGYIVILNFWSAECPWCERVDQELLTYLDSWKEQVFVWWIASNACDTIELIEGVAASRKLPTILIDKNQVVADLYGAQTTPHFFVIDRLGKLAYQGAWDDITFRQRIATQVYIPKVIESLIHNLVPDLTQTPPYGCALVRSFEEIS
jgi:peroxiredoxin